MNLFSQKKRGIVLFYYRSGIGQVSLEELKEKSSFWGIPFFVCQNEENGCGDVLFLLVKKKKKSLSELFFSGQQSCLISNAVGSMLCFYLRTKSLKVIDNIITNFRLMILGKKNFVLDDAFVDLKVFSDIHKFSHRIDCINMVLKGLEEALG